MELFCSLKGLPHLRDIRIIGWTEWFSWMDCFNRPWGSPWAFLKPQENYLGSWPPIGDTGRLKEDCWWRQWDTSRTMAGLPFWACPVHTGWNQERGLSAPGLLEPGQRFGVGVWSEFLTSCHIWSSCTKKVQSQRGDPRGKGPLLWELSLVGFKESAQC